MTKRFHFGYVLGDTGLIDEQATEVKWFIENCCSVSDLKKNWITVCNKLNELAEENEQLKIRFHEEREFAMRLSRECDTLTIKKQELELEIIRLEEIIKTGKR